MDYTDFMNSFVVRTDIFDDLTYLQKHLRLIVKFHQRLSSKLYVTSSSQSGNGTRKSVSVSKNFLAIRRFMDDLEEEMEDISREQKLLTDILKMSVNQYLEMLWNDCKIKIDSDISNGYITRALQFHYQKNCFTIEPLNVKVRMSEAELQQRFNNLRNVTDEDHAADRCTGQESLLKPKFRKSSSSAASTSGRVEKKMAGKKSTVIETRHAKMIYQKQEGIVNKRMNLLRALSKVKTDDVNGKPYSDDFNENSSSTLMISKYNRSDEDCSDQSSYDGMSVVHNVDPIKVPRKRRSPASNASSDNTNDWMKLLPPLPAEQPPKLDYDQEEFLSLFCLTTPAVAESLKIKRSKRKRRNCFKNERTDYHYGNFDLNEAAFRLRMTNNKRSILYSPNNKR